MSGLNRYTQHIFIITVALAITITFAILLADTFQATEFLSYRLSWNIALGNGITYNAGDETLTTLSPIWPLLLSTFDGQAHYFATFLFVTSVVASAGLLYDILRHRTPFSAKTCGLIIVIWLLSWPLWAQFRLADAMAFLCLIVAFKMLQQNRLFTAGMLISISILCDIGYGVPAAMLCLYVVSLQNSGRFWLSLSTPLLLWAIFAGTTYDSLGLGIIPYAFFWQDAIWLLLVILAILALQRLQSPGVIWIFPLWTTLEIIAHGLVTGSISTQGNMALPLTVALALAMFIQQTIEEKRQGLAVSAVIAGFIMLACLGLPQTDENLRHEINLAKFLDVSPESVIVHQFGDALPYFLDNFNGRSYRLDGTHTDVFQRMIQRGDIVSMLIATAPDYLITDDNNIPEDQRLAPLDYQLSQGAPLVYTRQIDLAQMDTVQSINLPLNPDVTLAHYALDANRLRPGDVMRVRLDWELKQQPQQPVGVSMNLSDLTGQIVASTNDIFSPETWQESAFSTWHVMRINNNAQPSVLSLNLVLEYRAGTVGRLTLDQLIIPFADLLQAEIPTVQLASISLYDILASQDNDTLTVETVWSVTTPLDQDYLMFLHLTPLDSPIPIKQADGPPADGRFPTSFWSPDDSIVDRRNISLEGVASGNYLMRVGFYLPDGTRLADEQGDSRVIAEIAIDENGNAELTPVTD